MTRKSRPVLDSIESPGTGLGFRPYAYLPSLVVMKSTANDSNQLVPCAIYTRVSTDEQAKEDHYSLAAQEDYCAGEIKKRQAEGWFLKYTISDPGYSGGILERPGLLKLIELVKSDEVKMIVVYSRSRLFRAASLAAQVQTLLDLHEVRVFSYTEGLGDSSPQSTFVRQLTDSLSELERAVTKARVRDAVRLGAKNGDWKGGFPPFGYTYTRGSKVLTTAEAETEIVRVIFTKVASGIELSEITADFRRRGLRARPSHKKSDGTPREVFFTIDSVKRIIRNPNYRGVVRVKIASPGNERAKGQGSIRWEEFKGRHTAIVSDELWFEANRAIDARGRGPLIRHRAADDRYRGLLQGLLRCEHCDAAMSPSAARKKKKNGEPHVYYKCSHYAKGLHESGCTTRQISKDATETAFKSLIQIIASCPEKITRSGFGNFDHKRAEAILERQTEIARVDAEISVQRRAIENLITFIRGGGPHSLAADACAEAENAKRSLAVLEQERMGNEDALRKLSAKIPPQEQIAAAFGFLARALSIADFRAQRDILQRTVIGVRLRRVTIACPGARSGSATPRTFRMSVTFNTGELLQLGRPTQDLSMLVTGYSDVELRVTFEVRSNAARQTVLLMEHGYRAVSSVYSADSSSERTDLSSSTLDENPVQRALRWQALISSGSMTASAVARQEKVSNGLVSQHLSLLKLPQLIIDFLRTYSAPTAKARFSLRELQRLLSLPASEAIARFQSRVSGRPVQQTLELRQ